MFSKLLRYGSVLSILLISQVSWSADSTISFKYKEISEQVRAQMGLELEKIYGTNCENRDYMARTRSGYGCGEIPFGKILNQKHKRIMNFTVPKGRVKNISKGFVNSTRKVNFDVLLDRTQLFSSTEISTIDFKKRIDVNVNRRIDRNLFLKMTPKGNELTTLACTFVPGLKIRIPKKKLYFYGQQKKKFLFFSKTFRFDSNVVVDPGYSRIKNVKICGLFETKMVGNSLRNLRPETKLLSLSNPSVRNFNFHGIKVGKVNTRFRGWFSRFLLSVAKALGFNVYKLVETEIQKGIKKEINKQLAVTKQEVRSGRWFQKAIGSLVGKAKFKNNIFRAYRRAVNKTTSSKRIFEEKLDGACFRAFRDLEQQANVRLDDQAVDNFCADLTAEVTVTPFTRNAIQQRRGCYNHFFKTTGMKRPNNKRVNRDYLGLCSTDIKVKVSGPRSLEDSRQCILEGLIDGQSNGQLISRCRNKVIADFTGLEFLSDLRRVANSDDPVSELVDQGMSLNNANRIAGLLGLL